MTKTPEELTDDWKAGKLHKRFERVSSIAQEEAIEIVELRRLLEECRPALSHLGKWNVQRQNLLIRINTALGESEEQ